MPADIYTEEWFTITEAATQCAITMCEAAWTAWMISEMAAGAPLVYPVCGRHMAMIELHEGSREWDHD